MGRHVAPKAPANDTVMASVVGALLLLLTCVCLLAVV
jgi:hypothetical protein